MLVFAYNFTYLKLVYPLFVYTPKVKKVTYGKNAVSGSVEQLYKSGLLYLC